MANEKSLSDPAQPGSETANTRPASSINSGSGTGAAEPREASQGGSGENGRRSIGLCLSGGGHRATVFALGALLYLIDAGRHQDIRVISSVSGGSLTNAFFALQEKPLSEMTQLEAEDAVAKLARQIAGSPGWFWASVAFLSAWTLLWWSQLASLLPFPADFWLSRTAVVKGWGWHALYIGGVTLYAWHFGRKCRGSFWGWWGTWVFLVVAVDFLVVALLVWFSPLSWYWCLLITVGGLSVPSLRNWVGVGAFEATVCGPPCSAGKRKLLKDALGAPYPVFCATEMRLGTHAFFCHDLVYADATFFVDRPRLATPGNLRVSAAVQASAAFPPLFPYRRIDADIIVGFPRDRELVLADGGVYDNLGTAWFLGARRRAEIIQRWRDGLSTAEKWEREGLERVLAGGNLSALQPPPDILMVVNSSPAHLTREIGRKPFPLNLVTTLKDLSETMYNQRGWAQGRGLWAEFLRRRNSGCVISIADHPRRAMTYLANPEKLWWLDNVYGALGDGIGQYREAAQRLVSRIRRNSSVQADIQGRGFRARVKEIWRDFIATLKKTLCLSGSRLRNSSAGWKVQADIQERCCEVGTTFRPLGRGATAELLYHGYQVAMCNAHLLLEGFPFYDDRQELAPFEELASGRRRDIVASEALNMHSKGGKPVV